MFTFKISLLLCTKRHCNFVLLYYLQFLNIAHLLSINMHRNIFFISKVLPRFGMKRDIFQPFFWQAKKSFTFQTLLLLYFEIIIKGTLIDFFYKYLDDFVTLFHFSTLVCSWSKFNLVDLMGSMKGWEDIKTLKTNITNVQLNTNDERWDEDWQTPDFYIILSLQTYRKRKPQSALSANGIWKFLSTCLMRKFRLHVFQIS